jgi:hypothetical protein
MKKWTKDEEALLLNQLRQYKTIDGLPIVSLAEKLDRTGDAVKRKAKRLLETMQSQYEWDKEESDEAFLLYLNGEALGSIHSRLQDDGSNFTLDQLEEEMKSRRKKADQVIRSYAEERQLKVAKQLSLETILLFRNNYKTTSDFTRKALHSRIARG